MTYVAFEPQSIELHLAAYSIVGDSKRRFSETAAPTLRGSLYTDRGGVGSVEVPLTDEERHALSAIIRAACERAEQLALARLAVSDQ